MKQAENFEALEWAIRTSLEYSGKSATTKDQSCQTTEDDLKQKIKDLQQLNDTKGTCSLFDW